MDGAGQSETGGCRSLFTAGCLLAFGACILAFLAIVAAIFILIWVVQFVWSFF